MKRFFLIEPVNFTVAYKINPWMGGNVDQTQAQAQWQKLVALIQNAGAQVETFTPPKHNLPDECFAANIGFALDGAFYASHFRFEQRRGEEYQGIEYFARKGKHRIFYEPTVFFEGEGDTEWAENGKIYCGYGPRTEEKALRHLEQVFKKPVTGIRIVDPTYYHLDTCFRSVSPDSVLMVKEALDEKAVRSVEKDFKHAYYLNDDEAKNFLCNSIVTKEKTLIVPQETKKMPTVKELQDEGFQIFGWDDREFKKSGGSARCLVLNLHRQ